MKLAQEVNKDEEIQLTSARELSPLMVEHHQPDIENLFDDVFSWSADLINRETPSHIYVNPSVAVYTDEESSEFYETARKFQANWCQRFRKIFGRRVLRKVSNWTLGPDGHKYTSKDRKQMKYFERSLCFQGLLFIDGKWIPNDKWPDRNEI